MQHDDRGRLVRRRPIGDGLQAFAVGEDVAGGALDPGKGGHCALIRDGRARSPFRLHMFVDYPAIGMIHQ